MKRFSGFSLILAAILCLSAAVVAQDQRTISVEKKKLIAELLVLTKAEQQVVEITDKMLESMQTAYPAIVAGLLERNSQGPDEAKAGLQEAMLASFQSFSEKFRQRLPIEIDYRQFVETLNTFEIFQIRNCVRGCTSHHHHALLVLS